ncbi:TrbI/VirB10 family protein [Luteibacter sp. 329MFSha]|uniref:TrbI/VirB10 family protein n=1 Tax=Luteibacter sp. 329MFSha TaxID=1798239 RepID=UPI0008D3544F|nr:TrbI/VirB10 family protein [Luteibacter sp. 329MFSha]SEW28463.1 type IV secretion system protein VirB10 [Luteibacter sp. 329MFSha]
MAVEKRPSQIESPDVDDERLPRPGESSLGVRRVNNVPLVIIGGVLVVFVVLVAMVAAQRGERKPVDAPEVPLAENNQALDQMLANGALGGIVPDPDESRAPSFPVARVEDPDMPPPPPPPAADAKDKDEMASERMKLFRTAMAAKTGLTKMAEPHATVPADREKGAENPGVGAAESGETDTRVPVAAAGDYGKYDRTSSDGKEKKDRWLLGSDVEAPRTTYEVRAGSVIPATMISGINSDLPGQIVAQVSQDVFDTATGRFRLIPQGSKLVGRYNHRVIMGQSRVLVAWQRLTFPDGKVIDIGAMEGVDGAGYAGFGDKVDRHYLRLFGSAILMSAVTSGLTSSRVDPDNDPFGSSNASTLSQSLAQEIGQVATKMIEKNMDIAPTLKIRPGYRFNVMAVKDLTFEKPYQAFDY